MRTRQIGLREKWWRVENRTNRIGKLDQAFLLLHIFMGESGRRFIGKLPTTIVNFEHEFNKKGNCVK